MERILYVNEDFCAVAEDGRLTEYIPAGREDGAGRILTGRVERMMPGLDAAFVDIGRKRAGFLPLKENSRTFQDPGIRSGDRIPVQIRKEEHGGKGAYLSRDLTIPGSLLLLMPLNRHIGVSARIMDADDRKRMLETGTRLAEGKTGLVIREAALRASEEELLREKKALEERWRGILAGETTDGGPEEELLRDYGPRGISRVVRDAELPADLIRQRKEAESRTVRLPHGGNIVLDRCEAMTVIDVNSASDPGDGNRRQTVLRTNLEACREIMIQVRLRNLSGILILDMIDMDEETDRSLVLDTLKESFREDRIKTVIHGYTRLGLIEMTRKRSRAEWQEQQFM